MRNRMIWGIVILILLLGITGVFLRLNRTPTEPEIVYKVPSDTSQPQREQNRVPKENAHVHEDGTFHAGEHDDPIETQTPPVSRDYTPAVVQIPEGITDPDVLAAWERLDYISKNRHQWGNFSARALELMAELTPVPNIYDHTEDEGCGGEFIPILDELAKLRDPRSAELLLTYQMDSGVSGPIPHEALRAMGPAAVPVLIARLDYPPGEDSLFDPLDLLPQIVAADRSELGGIVQHIIIPKIEAIAAYEGPGERADANKQLALNALEALLQKPGDR